MIHTVNDGPLIVSSTFWASDLARAGYFYLTPNGGCFRLLVPPGKGLDMAEMRTAKQVIITNGVVRRVVLPGMQLGREMTEIIFDDKSADPFKIYLSAPEQWERLPAVDDYGLFFGFTAWHDRRGTPHKILSRPCYLRRGELPCLQAWPKT